MDPNFKSHICPQCEALIFGADERSFEKNWEEHRATHKEEAEPKAEDLVPTDEDLEAAQKKAKHEAAIAEMLYKNEQDHLLDLEKHFDALSRIERKLPQLIDFGFKFGNAVGQWCKEKDWRTKALKLDMIYWTPTGDIACDFSYDKYDISTPEEPEFLKRGYIRLPKLHENYPAVFELVLTLGEHLTNIINNRRAQARDISFTNLHKFTSMKKSDMWAFKILNKRHTMRAAKVQF